MTYNLYTDGGSRGNPGKSACAFFIFNEKNEVVEFGGEFLGIGTNNNAEYLGLLLGLKIAEKQGYTNLKIYLDSELAVKQIRGEYKIKDENIKNIHSNISKILSGMTYEISHVERAKNKFADKLVNLILDQK